MSKTFNCSNSSIMHFVLIKHIQIENIICYLIKCLENITICPERHKAGASMASMYLNAKSSEFVKQQIELRQVCKI